MIQQIIRDWEGIKYVYSQLLLIGSLIILFILIPIKLYQKHNK